MARFRRLLANTEETDYTYQPTWMTWVSGSHGRPMKSLQMPQDHTSGQLCYVECEPVWMKLSITQSGFRSTQLSSIHSPHTWCERLYNHDWHTRTGRLIQSSLYPKGMKIFYPHAHWAWVGQWRVFRVIVCIGTHHCLLMGQKCCMVNMIANWRWTRETGYALL